MQHGTPPAPRDAPDSPETWAAFRVGQPQEQLQLLRSLQDGQVPLSLNGPDGQGLCCTLWAVDPAQRRLNFSAERDSPLLDRLVEADEAMALAFLDNVKLQFELQALTLVRAARSSVLQSDFPRDIYRFQRRSAYRVRVPVRPGPHVVFCHPSWPDMALRLRVVDVSIGGCSLWLPHDVPPLQAGTVIHGVDVELDAENRFVASIGLQHVASMGLADSASDAAGGVRLGCDWRSLAPLSERALQRWIDRTQRQQRLPGPTPG